ncbi:hypothetical protein SDC9_79752 [bioreactor metagenome]|uniref:Uncharacterized protein n=1 Tax=bioreactor metagenome TaxID=1076179 RepID=A0A644Z366_9ZZZZ
MTLAVGRPFAGHQKQVLRGLFLQQSRVSGVFGAFITAPQVPQIGAVFKVGPLLLVRHRDGVANITAEGFTAWVEGRAFLTAIKDGDGFIKMIVKITDI